MRRSNRSLNYLAPIRTTQTDNADDGSDGVTPLSAVPGSGQGWTNSQIANEAINSEKIAPGGVTSGDLADNSVTGSKINAGAVTGEKIASGAVTGDKVADGTLSASKLDADAQSGLASFAHVTLDGTLQGNRGFLAAAQTDSGTYVLTTANPVSTENCAVNTTVDDNTGNTFGFYSRYAVTGANQNHGADLQRARDSQQRALLDLPVLCLAVAGQDVVDRLTG